MTEKLKSCPFCPNGEGKLRKIHTNWGYGYRVTCQNCLATGSAGYSDRFKTDDDMEKFAIEAWNTRAEDENPPLTLDELRQMEGEPVWVESMANKNKSEWAFVKAIEGNKVRVRPDFHSCISLPFEKVKFYRRKPEVIHD